MKKKILIRSICTILALCVFAGMAMASGSSSSVDQDIKSVGTTADKNNETSVTTTEEKGTTIEEQVLVDQDDVKITAKSMSSSLFGPELKILIENDSDTDLIIQTRNASVNGYMVDTMISEEVAAGKKSNTSITFSAQALSECGITTFTEMEFYFHVFTQDDWETYFDSDVINVKTSAYGSYEQEIDDSGEVFYDEDGIKIIGKGLSNNDSIFGPGLIVYIENNTDTDFTVQVRDTSVNGFMIDTIMSEDVAAGKKAITAVTFFKSDLEENEITIITSIETSFHVFDMDGWDTIVDTDPITINF